MRESKGLTLNQVALYSEISAAQLSRIENGKRGVPKAPTIKKLAEALKEDYESLMRVAGYIEDESLSSKGDSFSEKDEKDIAKRIEAIKKDLSKDDGYMLMGEPMSEEAKESILDVMEYAIRQATRINKKYIPKKYRDNQE
ncbi:helix-turn-helix domain-containing protein [Priestia megaterium]|uniref:helix-turn-helix domain-containing protein n=1 Tax=Priestia megaterium TaxID=1404 RepID=UPI00398D1EB3